LESVLEPVRVGSAKHGRGKPWKITSNYARHAPHRDPSEFCKSLKLRQTKGNLYWRGLVHNHPSGDPTPSQADIQMTEAIIVIAAPVGISVRDHIIVGKNGHASLKGLRLI
jgi:hypothetical protein